MENVRIANAIIFSELKLEKGNRATDWTPAPEDQVNIGDVTSQLNSELKIDGNILAMTTGHFLVNATNLTITSDGTLTAANGYFKGKIEATSGYFGTYNPPTGSDDAWDPSYWLSADNGIIAMQAHSIRNTGNVSCSSDSATMSSYSSGGGHSSVQCAAGNLDLSASESLVLNGTDWDSLVYRQAGYDWSTFNTDNATDTWVPVMNGSKVNHRVIPADAFSASASGIFRKYGKVVVANFYGTSTSSLPWVPDGWQPTADVSIPVTVMYNGNPYMGYLQIHTGRWMECKYYDYGSLKGTPVSGSVIYGVATWITS